MKEFPDIDVSNDLRFLEMRARESITDKPVKTIIYSHFHGDHTGGASVFASDYAPEIIANESLTSFKVKSPVVKILGKRGTHQFGFDLPDSERLNFGARAQ